MATVIPYDPDLHDPESDSYTRCGVGGAMCIRPPEFTVSGPEQTISACTRHLATAVRDADKMPARAWT